MSYNILVVDDSGFVRKILVRSLTELFSSKTPIFTQADNGGTALELIVKNNFDLIFLDLTMPIMDGFTLLSKLKMLEISIPTIVLSGDIQDEAVRIVKELGVLGFLEKPFDLKQATKLLTELNLL